MFHASTTHDTNEQTLNTANHVRVRLYPVVCLSTPRYVPVRMNRAISLAASQRMQWKMHMHRCASLGVLCYDLMCDVVRPPQSSRARWCTSMYILTATQPKAWPNLETDAYTAACYFCGDRRGIWHSCLRALVEIPDGYIAKKGQAKRCCAVVRAHCGDSPCLVRPATAVRLRVPCCTAVCMWIREFPHIPA